jgi:hypothetical protein
MAAKYTPAEDGVVYRINSLGTGPGSEIFGMLCGTPGVPKPNVEFVGLEREEAWRDLFEIARDEFAARTDVLLDGFLTDEPTHMHDRGFTFGSFVLSDAARRAESASLVQSVRDTTSVDRAFFLDFSKYSTSPESSDDAGNPLRRAGYRVDAKKMADPSISILIRREIAACNPIYCKRNIKSELFLTMYTVHLR